jgi:hypothetical protein
MARLFIAAVCFLMVAKAAPAGQPIYKSMVECGAIYTASAEIIRSRPKKQMLSNAAKIWREAAVTEVAAARMPDAPSYVALMHDEKLRQWRGKGSMAALTQEYRDWTSYCLSLAGARGLDLRAN